MVDRRSWGLCQAAELAPALLMWLGWPWCGQRFPFKGVTGHDSRIDVKNAILDHKCHGTVIRDIIIQEQGIAFLYDMRKLLTFIRFARPHRSGQACVPFTICVSPETRSLSSPNLVPFFSWNVPQVLDPRILIKLSKTCLLEPVDKKLPTLCYRPVSEFLPRALLFLCLVFPEGFWKSLIWYAKNWFPTLEFIGVLIAQRRPNVLPRALIACTWITPHHAGHWFGDKTGQIKSARSKWATDGVAPFARPYLAASCSPTLPASYYSFVL